VERSAAAEVTGSLHGFPAALTSFIGRADVVDEIAAQLGQDRLVTLIGPGGAGETRRPSCAAGCCSAPMMCGCWWPGWTGCRSPSS